MTSSIHSPTHVAADSDVAGQHPAASPAIQPSAGALGAPRRSSLPRSVADRLAATEYERFGALLQTLAPEEWQLATDCSEWDVRLLACHVLGMAEMAASVRENLRQNFAAWRRGGVFIHALTALQVQERAGLSRSEIVARFLAVGPRAARGRAATPGLLRRMRMPVDQPVGDVTEPWTFGFLLETILTRDTWMHRVDLARAVKRALVLASDHDGVLVADIVAEWAARHAEPCRLSLSGPAGGAWTFGQHGPHIELDAVDFCRILAGRAPAVGLLRTQVPF